MLDKIGPSVGYYDYYAKIIPGLLLLTGFITLLPAFPLGDIIQSVGDVLTITIITAVISFVLGELFHVVISIFQALGYNTLKLVAIKSGKYSLKSKKDSKIEYLGKILSFTFMPFEECFKRELSRRGEDESLSGLFDWFKLHMRNLFKSLNMDLLEKHELIYNTMLSEVQYSGRRKSVKFHALSVFSFGFSLLLFTFSTIYFLLYVEFGVFADYSPIIGELIIEHPSIVLILYVLSIISIYSSNKYKSKFVRYLLVEYYLISIEQKNQSDG